MLAIPLVELLFVDPFGIFILSAVRQVQRWEEVRQWKLRCWYFGENQPFDVRGIDVRAPSLFSVQDHFVDNLVVLSVTVE